MKQQKERPGFFRTLMIWALVLALLAGTLVVGTNLYVGLTVRGDICALEDAEDMGADCILILGCGLRRDGFPSQMLRDRLDVGIAAYEKGLADRLLMSGDHGREDYDEVNAMKDYAISKGVPSEDIFMDHAGFSTYESMYRARKIFGCEKIIVVTQNYHLYRAVYDAKAMGMETLGIPSNIRHFAPTQWVKFRLREVAARTKDFAFCILKPEPTYLGEAISIFGNGDITNDR